MKIKLQRIGVLLVTGFMAGSVFPGEKPAEDKIEEIVTTAKSIEETLPQKLADNGHRLEVVSGATITLGGYQDISQTLQMEVPGFYIAQKTGAFDYMNCALQGSRCEDILWLVDGVRINNRLYNSTTPLDTIPAHMVERIEVLYGGQGIFYGTQSMAGVVNIVTKSHVSNKSYGEETGGNIGIGANNKGGTHFNGDFSAAFGNSQLVLYGSKDETDGFQAIRTADLQPSQTHRKRAFDISTLGFKYSLDLSEQSRVSLHYHHTDARLDNMRAYRNYLAYNDRDEDMVTLKLDQSVSDALGLFVKAYYHSWDTVWTRIENVRDSNGLVTGELNPVFQDTYWGYKDYGLNLGSVVETNHGLSYTLGYDYQRFSGSDDVWLIEDKTESVNAVFAQISTSQDLFADTRLSLGVRYNKTANQSDSIWNLSGQHNFTDNLYLRGSVGTAFRLPDAEELYLRDCCERGNPNLEPEKSFNANIGLGGNISLAAGLHWEINLFHREVDQLIDIDYSNPDYPGGIFENRDTSVDFQGWELTASLNITDSLQAGFDYVYTVAEAEGVSGQLQDVPRETLKSSLTFAPDILPLEFKLSVSAVGEVYDQVGSLGRQEHGDYLVTDFSGAWYPDGQRQHRLGFKVENLFDETYDTRLGRSFTDTDNSAYAYGFLGTPRTVHFNYSYRF